MNATWEDWEQYHHRQQAGNKSPDKTGTYMSNTTFVAAMIILTLLGAVAQTHHAENTATARMALREEHHAKATRELARAKEAARNSTREARIQSFMRQREPSVLENERLTGLIINQDLCESGDAVGRSNKELDMRRKWK